MGFQVGINAGSNLMLGDQQVHSLRLGDNLVWQRETTPPGFNPADLAPWAWFDASNAGSITLDGAGNVAALADLSGNGRTASATSTATAPLLLPGTSPSALGGRAVLLFDGDDDFLQLPNAAITETVTFAIVAQRQGSLGGWRTLFGKVDNYFNVVASGNGSDHRLTIANGEGPGAYHAASGYIQNPVLWISQPNRTLEGDPRGMRPTTGRANGVTDLGPAFLYGAQFETATFALARTSYQYGRENWPGVIGEVLVWDRTLTEAEVLDVETWLAQKWRLQAVLPENHPGYDAG